MNFFFFDYRFKSIEDLAKDLNILKDLGYEYIVITLKQIDNHLIQKISEVCLKNDFDFYVSLLNKKHKKYISIFEPRSREELNELLKKYYVDVILDPSSFVEPGFILHGTKSSLNKNQLRHIKNKALFIAIPYTKILKTDSYIKMYQTVQDLMVCYSAGIPTIVSFSDREHNLFRDPWLIIEFFEQTSNGKIPRYWIRDCLTNYPLDLIELIKQTPPGVKEL